MISLLAFALIFNCVVSHPVDGATTRNYKTEQSVSRKNIVPQKDVKGYQGYSWGQSTRSVLADFRKKGLIVEVRHVAKETELNTKGELHFDDILLSVEIKKQFCFYNDSLYLVSMTYEPEALSVASMEKVFGHFEGELLAKYGEAQSDSLAEEDSYAIHSTEWDFKSSSIRLRSVHIDVSFMDTSTKSLDLIFLSYISKTIMGSKTQQQLKATKEQL